MILTREFLNEFFRCTTCKEILSNPISSLCRHSFCKKCIYEHPRFKFFCKECNRYLKEYELYPNQEIKYTLKLIQSKIHKENKYEDEMMLGTKIGENEIKVKKIEKEKNSSSVIKQKRYPARENDNGASCFSGGKFRYKRAFHSFSENSYSSMDIEENKTDFSIDHKKPVQYASEMEKQLDVFLDEFQSGDAKLENQKYVDINLTNEKEILEYPKISKRFKR